MNVRIEKNKEEIELFLVGQDPLKGFVFLDRNCPSHEGPERVLDLLRSREPFFPFETDTGTLMLVRKTAVRKLSVGANYELEIIQSYGKKAIIYRDVEIVLTDGTHEKGILLIDYKENFSRPLDQANRSRGFLLCKRETRALIIGEEHITAIIEADAK